MSYSRARMPRALSYARGRSEGWPAPGHGARISTRRASRLRAHLVALVGGRQREQASASARGRAVRLDLDLTVHDQDPCPLVDLVVLKLLARGQVDQDRPALLLGVEHLRAVRLDVERSGVPGLHGRLL